MSQLVEKIAGGNCRIRIILVLQNKQHCILEVIFYFYKLLYFRLISVKTCLQCFVAFSALTLLVGRQEGHPAHKKYGVFFRWALDENIMACPIP